MATPIIALLIVAALVGAMAPFAFVIMNTLFPLPERRNSNASERIHRVSDDDCRAWSRMIQEQKRIEYIDKPKLRRDEAKTKLDVALEKHRLAHKVLESMGQVNAFDYSTQRKTVDQYAYDVRVLRAKLVLAEVDVAEVEYQISIDPDAYKHWYLNPDTEKKRTLDRFTGALHSAINLRSGANAGVHCIHDWDDAVACHLKCNMDHVKYTTLPEYTPEVHPVYDLGRIYAEVRNAFNKAVVAGEIVDGECADITPHPDASLLPSPL